MTLTTNLSLGNLGKPWHLGLAKRFPGRNRSKRKHTKSRDTLPERSGEIYSKKFCNKSKVTSQSGVGDGFLGAQAASRRGQEVGRARGAPGPPGARLRLHLGLELLWRFAMFPYRNSYLFLFCFCQCLK